MLQSLDYLNETFQEIQNDKKLEHYLEEISVIFLCISTITLNIFIISFIQKIKELKIKRNILVSNWCMLNLLAHTINIINFVLHLENFLYVIGYTTTGVCYTGMIILILIFITDGLYDSIKEYNIKTWIISFRLSLITLLILELFIRHFKTNWFISSFLYLPLAIMIFFIYLVETVCYVIEYIRNRPVDEESQFRYMFASIYILCTYCQFLVTVHVTALPDVTIVYFIEFAKLIFILLLLIKFDNNFKYHMKKLFLRKDATDMSVIYNQDNIEDV